MGRWGEEGGIERWLDLDLRQHGFYMFEKLGYSRHKDIGMYSGHLRTKIEIQIGILSNSRLGLHQELQLSKA